MNNIDLIKKSGLFDENYYLEIYPDVKEYLEKHHGVPNDIIAHYLKYGANELRNPSEKFNTRYYLETYPDVVRSRINPLIHYILYGYKEDRRPCKPKYFLTMATCIKNEEKYLDEWLSYHIYQGVEHFYLNNDNSTDRTKEVLLPYIKKGYVTLYENLREKGIAQNEFYYLIIDEKRNEAEWCCFFDADEFYQGNMKLNEFLESLDNDTSGVELFWKIYGSAGLKTYDKRFVIERFNTHRTIQWQPNDFIKSICRLKNTKPTESVHIFHYNRGKVINALREDISQIPEHERVYSLPLIWENAWLNHYFFKSREEYLKKVKRGNANNDEPRADTFYDGGDRNDVIDDSMKQYVAIIKSIIEKIRDE